jgi:hypothetical protein
MTQTDSRPGFRLPWAAADQGDPAEAAEATTRALAAGDAGMSAGNVRPAMTDTTTTATVAPRRATKFLAELSRAMQVAAEKSRDETLARLEADLKVVVEEINAASAVGAADLRRRADDDVAAVREWSKAEIARVREETEARIALRKTALDGEMEAHVGVVATRVERVSATVAEFETEMAGFFERLRAEEDPTRIATMAETMPDPPDLTGVAASVAELVIAPFDPASPVVADPAVDPAGPDARSSAAAIASRPDFAAAEAEAAAFSADLDDDADNASTEHHDQRPGEGAAATNAHASAGGRTTTNVTVLGLVSVASIATFKRSLGRAAGVSGIAVASGPDGEFVFTVTHDAGIDLADAIRALPGFEAEVTAAASDALHVIAQDPDTGA